MIHHYTLGWLLNSLSHMTHSPPESLTHQPRGHGVDCWGLNLSTRKLTAGWTWRSFAQRAGEGDQRWQDVVMVGGADWSYEYYWVLVNQQYAWVSCGSNKVQVPHWPEILSNNEHWQLIIDRWWAWIADEYLAIIFDSRTAVCNSWTFTMVLETRLARFLERLFLG